MRTDADHRFIPRPEEPQQLASNGARRGSRTSPVRRIVVRSLLTGWLVAGLLTMVVFGGAQEPVTTGAALLGFGLGWALRAARPSG